MSIVVYIEELMDNKVDSSCYIEYDEGVWILHTERFNQNTFSFTNKQRLINFLSLYFDLANSQFNTSVYVVDRNETDIDDISNDSELFGYDDVKFDTNILLKYVNLCETTVDV